MIDEASISSKEEVSEINTCSFMLPMWNSHMANVNEWVFYFYLKILSSNDQISELKNII